MNACHSGRLIKDNKNINNTDQRTGFATFFLERGSQGVIGTLGMVHDEYAAKISQSFFEEYEKDPSRPVAEIIRYLKEQSVKNFIAEKTKENKYLFLFTFMYIYYGNPMTRLKLISQGE
jgi:N-methylhydantoinase A/oxoprolinase/acetone carboxylase beta subunit